MCSPGLHLHASKTRDGQGSSAEGQDQSPTHHPCHAIWDLSCSSPQPPESSAARSLARSHQHTPAARLPRQRCSLHFASTSCCHLWPRQRRPAGRHLGPAGDKRRVGLGPFELFFTETGVGACREAPSHPRHREVSFIPHPQYSHLLLSAHSQPSRGHVSMHTHTHTHTCS